MYRQQYRSYRSDDERVELIRNMLVKVNIYILCYVLLLSCLLLLYRMLAIVEQVSELKDVSGDRLVSCNV